MMSFAFLVALLWCHADAKFIESAPTEFFDAVRHTLDSLSHPPGLAAAVADRAKHPSVIDESIRTLRTSSALVDAFGKAYQSFVQSPGGFVPALLGSIETLRATPAMGHAVARYIRSIKKVPRAMRKAAKKVKKLHIPGISSMANYLLKQIDASLDHTRSTMTKELIIHYMDHCRNVGNASVFRLAHEIYKYKSFETGPQLRKKKAEECYDELRKRVTRALKKGWIRPLENPPCRNGWGSFNLYQKGSNLRFMNANRYLPCEEI